MSGPAPQPVAGRRIRASELATIHDLEQHASACTLCRLCYDRVQVVTGSGPANADVLVVAEAPGYHDDRSGVLLTGEPGRLFEEVLELAGRTRDEVFLTSVVKCRPPTGRMPFPDEVEACEGWLFRELALVRPQVVVTLGSLALRLVTGTMLHAQIQGRDVVVWPLYHPAAARQVDRLADELRADARALGRLLRGASSQRVVEGVVAPAGVEPMPAVAPASAPNEPQLSFDV